MLLGCLEFNDDRWPSRLRGFREMAREFGYDVESISYDGTPESLMTAYLRARDLINEAAALFVPNSLPVVGFDHELANLIRSRVKAGIRLLIQPWINNLDDWNAFLAPYDLTVTTLKICKRHGKSLACAPGDELTISRSAHSFRDPLLFQGVQRVLLAQPIAIWYCGESLPVLCATDGELPIDALTDLLPVPELQRAEGDLFPPEWNARELACMAVWHGDNDGAVLASIGPALNDPLIQENSQLAKNIIRWLCGAQRPLSPEERCHRIEVNLVDFVFGVVKMIGENWWTERIPLPIRQKCAQRHEEEMCRLPKEAYLDLIDLKTIMGKEWGLFEPHLRAVGCAGGKEKSLAWLDRLNEIRRLMGHPLKKHVAGYTFTEDEVAFLKDCDELVRKLFRRVKPAMCA